MAYSFVFLTGMKTIILLSALFAGTFYTLKPAVDTLFYISLNKATHLGHYDGTATIKELKAHGNFGLGSEAGLASELILLDGKAYGFAADGTAKIMSAETKLAFAAAKFFKPENTLEVNEATSLKELKQLLAKTINRNAFAAIRINATFREVEYRCFLEQEKPYRPLKDTPYKLFKAGQTEGTLAGFYTPAAAEVLNSPEYHFHFINASRTGGGHLDDCIIEKATIEIDYASELKVHLPELPATGNVDLSEE